MNMMGNFAGGFSPLVVGYLLAWTAQNWTMTFYISPAIYFLGAICWLFLDSHRATRGVNGRAGLSRKWKRALNQQRLRPGERAKRDEPSERGWGPASTE